jgi:hypothetical protein
MSALPLALVLVVAESVSLLPLALVLVVAESVWASVSRWALHSAWASE